MHYESRAAPNMCSVRCYTSPGSKRGDLLVDSMPGSCSSGSGCTDMATLSLDYEPSVRSSNSIDNLPVVDGLYYKQQSSANSAPVSIVMHDRSVCEPAAKHTSVCSAIAAPLILKSSVSAIISIMNMALDRRCVE